MDFMDQLYSQVYIYTNLFQRNELISWMCNIIWTKLSTHKIMSRQTNKILVTYKNIGPPPPKKMVPQYCKRMNGHSPSECWEVLYSQLGMWNVKMAKRFHHIRRNTGIGWLFWENLSFHRSGTEIGRDSWPRK